MGLPSQNVGWLAEHLQQQMSALWQSPLVCLPFSGPQAPGAPSLPIASTCVSFSEGFPQAGRAQVWTMGITLPRICPETMTCGYGSVDISALLPQARQSCDPTLDSKAPCGTESELSPGVLDSMFYFAWFPPFFVLLPISTRFFTLNFQVWFYGTQFKTILNPNLLLLFLILLMEFKKGKYSSLIVHLT